MIIILKLVTFSLGTLTLFFMIKDYFIKENYNTIIYPSSVFYFFCYLPLFYDMFFGRPTYTNKNFGFIISGSEPLVEVIYCVIIIYISLVLRMYQKKFKFYKKVNINNNYSNIIFIIAIVVMTVNLLPIIFDKELFNVIINYDIWYYREEKYSSIKFISFFYIIASLFLLVSENRQKAFFVKLFILIPYLYLAVLMNGKRNIVFILFVGLIYIMLTNRIIKNKIIYIFLIPLLIGMLFSYSSWYQERFDRVSNSSDTVEYTSMRVNYGRDDTMKMVIHSEIQEGNQLLDYRGQSLLFYPTFAIPRVIWTEKPYTFGVYLTSYMVGNIEASPIGWTMTTSVIDELIANLGFLGAILSPFFFILLCGIGMKYSNGILGSGILSLTILLSMLAIAVHLAAFVTSYLLLIACVLLYKMLNKSGRVNI